MTEQHDGIRERPAFGYDVNCWCGWSDRAVNREAAQLLGITHERAVHNATLSALTADDAQRGN